MGNVRNNPGLLSEASHIFREYEVLQDHEISLTRLELFSVHCLPISERALRCYNGPRLGSLVLLTRAVLECRRVWSIPRITLTGENSSTRTKTRSSGTSSNTNLISTSLGLKSILSGERPRILNLK